MQMVLLISLWLIIIKTFIISIYPYSLLLLLSAVTGKHSNQYNVYTFVYVLIKRVLFCIHILTYRNDFSHSILFCFIFLHAELALRILNWTVL